MRGWVGFLSGRFESAKMNYTKAKDRWETKLGRRVWIGNDWFATYLLMQCRPKCTHTEREIIDEWNQPGGTEFT